MHFKDANLTNNSNEIKIVVSVYCFIFYIMFDFLSVIYLFKVLMCFFSWVSFNMLQIIQIGNVLFAKLILKDC